MRIDGDREMPNGAHHQWRRNPNGKKFEMRAIPHRRCKVWQTTLYRRVKDIDANTRPPQKRYEWDLMEKRGARKDYKRKENGTGRKCATQEDFLESEIVSPVEIDESVRRYNWEPTCRIWIISPIMRSRSKNIGSDDKAAEACNYNRRGRN